MIIKKLYEKYLNETIEKEYRFHPVRRWRFDYAIPKYKIAIEIDGGIWTNGRHTRPKGYLGDIEKFNTAASMGWLVFKFTPQTINTKYALDLVKKCINNFVEQK